MDGRFIISPVAEDIKPLVPPMDICGLTKHEYMALELTKACASTKRCYYDVDEIVDIYEEMLKELKERNL